MPVQNDSILLAHGGGGMLSKALIATEILPVFSNPALARLDDAACVPFANGELVLTTDSYVVDPLAFPGGNIGTLAACGTLNDLAMQGAAPSYMALGLILEEGLPLVMLRLALRSLAEICTATGVPVITGDTKVVERGRGSGLFINTTGVGARLPGIEVGAGNARPGDLVLLSGPMADHGIAVMSQRAGLAFETPIQSDVAALWPMIEALLRACPEVHVLRDPTRGGVTMALHDIAEASCCGIRLQEDALPIRRETAAACRLLGLDPLQVANEGKAIVIVPAAAADRALAALRRHHLGSAAAVIGTVVAEDVGLVTLRTRIGGERILRPPAGDQLPRIC